MKFLHLVQPSLEAACRALFPAASAHPREGDPSLCRAAVIGFAGDEVRGTLGIATSQAGLERVLENSGAHRDARHCSVTGADDSLGELANLIVGAVKRAWLRREVQVTLATPLVVRGFSIEVHGGVSGHWFSVESSHGGEELIAWMDIHCDETLEVPEADVAASHVMEGQTLLF